MFAVVAVFAVADVVVIVVVFDGNDPVSMEQDPRSVVVVDEDVEVIASCHCLWIAGVWRNAPVSD